MNTKYEHKNAMTFIGFYTHIAPNEGYEKCPKFWDDEYNAKYARLWQTMKPENEVEKAILDNGIGMYAICADGKDGFTYWIAGLYNGGNVPQGLSLFTFPESDWAVFSTHGALPHSLQALNTDVWGKWYPTAKEMYDANGSATIEVYSAKNPQSDDYECGLWVPIRKKGDIKICQSCGMPINSDDMCGKNADGTLSEYCRYCYDNGNFTEEMTMEEFIEKCSMFASQAGMTADEMKEYCKKVFPTLKRWKK